MDTLDGLVKTVIDGDTFDLIVMSPGIHNSIQYNNSERIRIRGFDAPEFSQLGGQRSKESLELAFSTNSVRCTIHERDEFGKLICDVQVTNS